MWALVADVHGNLRALERALADAHAAGAVSAVFVGDALGGLDMDEACCRLLMHGCDRAVFGNREVQVRLTFSEDVQRWIRDLPATTRLAEALLCLSSPASRYPCESTAGDALEFRRGLRYFDLFPFVSGKTAARAASAALPDPTRRAVVHGHTHRQAVWRIECGGAAPIRGKPLVSGERRDWDVPLDADTTVVGLGSVGLGKNGRVEFGLYHPAKRRIRLVSLPGE